MSVVLESQLSHPALYAGVLGTNVQKLHYQLTFFAAKYVHIFISDVKLTLKIGVLGTFSAFQLHSLTLSVKIAL